MIKIHFVLEKLYTVKNLTRFKILYYSSVNDNMFANV